MGLFTTAARTWGATEVVTATNLNAQLKDFINGFGAWTSYTPTWTGSTTNPVIGNGTITGAYTQIGKMVWFRAEVTTGSTTTFGSGAYSLSLPVTAIGTVDQPVLAMAFDTSTGFYYRGVGRIQTTTISRTHFVDGVTGPSGWTSAVPFTWQINGDKFWFQGTYEAA